MCMCLDNHVCMSHDNPMCMCLDNHVCMSHDDNHPICMCHRNQTIITHDYHGMTEQAILANSCHENHVMMVNNMHDVMSL